MTLPRADKLLLMNFASSILSKVFSPSLSLSLPAKSTKVNFDMTVDCYSLFYWFI